MKIDISRYETKFGAFAPFMLEIVVTTIFAYLLFDALMVIKFNGPFSRINLLSFLIPHSSKIAIWSAFTLLYLKPRFGWRFGFAMVLLYSSSELLTNWIYVPIHIFEQSGYLAELTDVQKYYYFPLSNVFFICSFILCYLFLKGRYTLKWDWAILPFAVWVASWVLLGYNTDSTIARPSYWIETQEFVWNALYLIMVGSIFKPNHAALWHMDYPR